MSTPLPGGLRDGAGRALGEIPVLSLAPALDDGAGEAALGPLARRLDAACRALGFLVITDHGIEPAVLERAFALTREFFDGDQASKDRWHPRGAAKQRGYHGYETRGLAATLGRKAPLDLRESLFFGPVDDHLSHVPRLPEADRAGGATAYAPNVYPDRPGGLAPGIIDLYRHYEVLSRRLLRVMAVALGAPAGHFTDKIGRHFSILACHHYPPPPAPPKPGQLRTGEHTDFGAFTILAMTGGDGGLEVRLPDGRWQSLVAGPGQLVVNLGDMMARWTNDRWVSTLHRVANPTGRGGGGQSARRQSIGYFMHPDYDARVECVPGVLAPGETPRYAPITAGEHIRAKIARSHGDR